MTGSEVIKNKVIPPLYRKEWSYFITDYIEGKYEFKNFGLQLLSNQIQERLLTGLIVEHQAVIELFRACVKYHASCQDDLKKVFVKW